MSSSHTRFQSRPWSASPVGDVKTGNSGSGLLDGDRSKSVVNLVNEF